MKTKWHSWQAGNGEQEHMGFVSLSLSLVLGDLTNWDGNAAMEGRCGKAGKKHNITKCLFHQFVHSPADIQSSQVTVVLTHTQENHRNAGGVYHADERADHVAHGVALGDDEAVHADAVVAELAL